MALASLLTPARAVWDWEQTRARLEEVGLPYELVDVDVEAAALAEEDGGRALRIEFGAFERTWRFDLEQDTALFPGGVLEHKHVNAAGKTIETRQERMDCFYRTKQSDGHVVLANNCGDKISATIETDQGRLALVPVMPARGARPARSLVYWIDSRLDKPFSCEHMHAPENALAKEIDLEAALGIDLHRDLAGDLLIGDAAPAENTATRLRPRGLASKTEKFIKLVIVNDNARFNEYGDQTHMNSAQILQSTVELYNKLNDITSSFTLTIQVVGMITFAHKDFWTPEMTSDGEVNEEVLLQDFSTWRAQLIGDNDIVDHGVAQLLSGLTFRDQTVGLAHVDVLCSKSSGTGVVQATDAQLSTVAAILAHELAHNLGVKHTNTYLGEDTLVEEPCTAGSWIMDPSGVNERTWSSCSAGWIEMAFSETSYPLGCSGGDCLYRPSYGRRYSTCADDAATSIWTLEPACGNGVRETGEDCDCGQDDCGELDPCCDGATCSLLQDATCSADDICCDASTCQPRAAEEAYECRASVDDDCDSAEVCDGISASCPYNSYEENGSTCGDRGACFIGECKSHVEQCGSFGYVPCPAHNHNDGDDSCGSLYCRTDSSSDSCFKVSGSSDSGTLVEDGTTCGGNLEDGQDPSERGVCSGSTCVTAGDLQAPSSITCFNGLLDDGETDVDCGGTCSPCLPGEVCLTDDDCFSTSGQPAYCKKENTPAPTSSPVALVDPPVGYTCRSYDDDPETCAEYSACVYLEDFSQCKPTGALPPNTGKCDSQKKEESCISWWECTWDESASACNHVPTPAPTALEPGVCTSSVSSTSSGDDDEESDSPFDNLLKLLQENKITAIASAGGALVFGLLLMFCVCRRHCRKPSDAELRRRASAAALKRNSRRPSALGTATSLHTASEAMSSPRSNSSSSASLSTASGRSSRSATLTTNNSTSAAAVVDSGTSAATSPTSQRAADNLAMCPECVVHYSNPNNVRGLCNSCEAKRKSRIAFLVENAGGLPAPTNAWKPFSEQQYQRSSSLGVFCLFINERLECRCCDAAIPYTDLACGEPSRTIGDLCAATSDCRGIASTTARTPSPEPPRFR
ncbi:Zinc metalloproteinase-disintegrin-like [Hondaea fermentalgiana]|uniref:Zinc metalloproteinase-disintegrin-like n=1 Tax=Hondaea fermentalgiana TaxID=2315210 RepID=A0A2R5GL19_9STRA|nr:Zinc metalloproteinase-disintegrin-like [Hondaea fermentalgiana]|eukprot:GBG31335.1 Zinc metalloproteinase-disintegrin-like [Hondaea fermentalgiana]